jgi:ABC-type transporter Mla subunit MlaD
VAATPELQRRDLLTGLFVLASVGVILGALVITSGVLHRQYAIYMRVANAQDLTPDTRVQLQGLAVGRVRQVDPVMDGTSGALSFVARLSIDAVFPNGARVAIPRGTRAVIEQVNPIAPPVIQLIVPATGGGDLIAAGDTIASERRQGAVDVLSGLATDLSKELHQTIADTRALLVQTTRAAARTTRLVDNATPRVQQALDQLSHSLDRADGVLAELGPRVGPTADSLVAVLSEAREAMHRVNALADTAQSIVSEDRVTLQETLQHLHNSAVVLEHFADQVSRRPTRLLTGVKPPPADTARNQP